MLERESISKAKIQQKKEKPLKYNIMRNMTNVVFISVPESARFIQEQRATCSRVRENTSHLQPFGDLNYAKNRHIYIFSYSTHYTLT